MLLFQPVVESCDKPLFFFQTGMLFTYPLHSLPVLDKYQREPVESQPYNTDNTMATRFHSLIQDRYYICSEKSVKKEIQVFALLILASFLIDLRLSHFWVFGYSVISILSCALHSLDK